MTGRSCEKDSRTLSAIVSAAGSAAVRITASPFIRTQATYQTARIARTTTVTGPAWPAIIRVHSEGPPVACRAGMASVVIGVPRLQALANALGDLEELRALAHLEGPITREAAFDHVDDPAGPRRHHDDPGREIDGLGNGMGDEDDRLAGRPPEIEELLVE